MLLDTEILVSKESMTPARIKNIRKQYHLTQLEFAELLNIKYTTYKKWEIGNRYPSSPGYALLYIAEQYPDTFLKSREKFIEYVKKNYI